MDKLLTVVLLCHNRVQMAVEALESIIAQTTTEFRLVVSDNSTNEDLRARLAAEFPAIEVVSWYPGVPAFDHFNNVIAMIDTRYFVMFHDDDLMEPEYVETILERFRKHPSAAAIGTNAIPIDGSGTPRSDRHWFQGEPTGSDRIFVDQLSLLQQYLVVDRGGIAPFPSYAYNSELVRGLTMQYSVGRAYCDTVFLLEIMKRGPLIWIDKPLLRVRIHATNQSNLCAVRDYKIFVSWVKREFGARVSRRHLDEYRLPRLYLALANRHRFPAAALKYFLCAMPRLLVTSKSFRQRICRKLLGGGGAR